jgi:hypothetical protein
METKDEILEIVNKLPEEDLVEVLDHLRKFKKTSSRKVNLLKNLDKVMDEDRELLHRLAK